MALAPHLDGPWWFLPSVSLGIAPSPLPALQPICFQLLLYWQFWCCRCCLPDPTLVYPYSYLFVIHYALKCPVFLSIINCWWWRLILIARHMLETSIISITSQTGERNVWCLGIKILPLVVSALLFYIPKLQLISCGLKLPQYGITSWISYCKFLGTFFLQWYDNKQLK